MRIKKLLIPLDGSLLAESVLPLASQLARKMNVSITLIHVIEKDAPEKIHGQLHLTGIKQAKDYLNSVASQDIFKGIQTDVHVHETGVKSVSQSISSHSRELQQDLIILCTHGSGGLHDFIFGSIAQQVISFGSTPVVLIHPGKENEEINSSFKNFLIPLDGNPDHEGALETAEYLAEKCNAKIHLLVAIPYFGNMSGDVTAANRFLPGTTAKMMDMIVNDANEYLEGLKTKLEKKGHEVSASAFRSEPANAIAETAKEINADLIILATHGTKGAEAFWEGSVTPKISKISKVPLLLVPVNR